MNELTELDQEQIASQISKGFTSGIIDYDDENNQGIRIAWELKYNKFIT
jgi:hypothetical protein